MTNGWYRCWTTWGLQKNNNPRHSEGYQPGQGQSQLQGYGILGSHPAPFDTADAKQFDAALDFYHQNGVRLLLPPPRHWLPC